MSDQFITQIDFFCNICDKQFSLPNDQVMLAEKNDTDLLCTMCKSEFIHRIEK